MLQLGASWLWKPGKERDSRAEGCVDLSSWQALQVYGECCGLCSSEWFQRGLHSSDTPKGFLVQKRLSTVHPPSRFCVPHCHVIDEAEQARRLGPSGLSQLLNRNWSWDHVWGTVYNFVIGLIDDQGVTVKIDLKGLMPAVTLVGGFLFFFLSCAWLLSGRVRAQSVTVSQSKAKC